ncbi:5597_t:CDS:1, partial [Racocetra persica]
MMIKVSEEQQHAIQEQPVTVNKIQNFVEACWILAILNYTLL